MTTRDECKQILLTLASNGKSYAQNIYEMWLESIDQCNSKILDEKRIHSPSVEAMLTWSYMSHKIKGFALDERDKDKNVRFVNVRGMKLLIINDKVAFRFKKADKKNKTSNWLTDQVDEFKTQKLELGLDTKLTFVDAVYKLDDSGMAVEEILFQCPSSHETNQWALLMLDLGITTPQTKMFEYEEKDVVPVLGLKAGVKKQNNFTQNNNAV
jgi:hypothetical protein